MDKFESFNDYIEYLYQSINDKTIKCEDIKKFTDTLSCAITDYLSYSKLNKNNELIINKAKQISILSKEKWRDTSIYINQLKASMIYTLDTSNITVELI